VVVWGRWLAVAFFFSSRRRHTRFSRDWSSDVCSSDLGVETTWRPLSKPDFHQRGSPDFLRGSLVGYSIAGKGKDGTHSDSYRRRLYDDGFAGGCLCHFGSEAFSAVSGGNPAKHDPY